MGRDFCKIETSSKNVQPANGARADCPEIFQVRRGRRLEAPGPLTWPGSMSSTFLAAPNTCIDLAAVATQGRSPRFPHPIPRLHQRVPASLLGQRCLRGLDASNGFMLDLRHNTKYGNEHFQSATVSMIRLMRDSMADISGRMGRGFSLAQVQTHSHRFPYPTPFSQPYFRQKFTSEER